MNTAATPRLLAPALGALGLLALLASSASARPTGPQLVCEARPGIPACQVRQPACTLCHTTIVPLAWNDFGEAVHLALEGDYDTGLAAAIDALESKDSDGDGLLDGEELSLGTLPGRPTPEALVRWARSQREAAPVPRRLTWTRALGLVGDVLRQVLGGDALASDGRPLPEDYELGLAYRRVNLLFCGRSPTYEDASAFAAAETREARYRLLHRRLASCLEDPWWLERGLRQLAHDKVLAADHYYRGTFFDFEYDYNLFAWAMSHHRDARELLLADFHVDRDAAGALTRVEGVIPSIRENRGGQPLPPERRAGMLTTRYFLIRNVMAAGLPRVAAGHAYRAYLGLDLSQLEGIHDVVDPHLDIDEAGVSAPGCAVCHRTLDPLAYAFARYEGVPPGRTTDPTKLGSWDDERPERYIDDWPRERSDEPVPHLLGQPVGDLVEWAQVAANSEPFRENLVRMLFRYATGREPGPGDHAAYAEIVRDVPALGWSANAIIHRVVDTRAFAARASDALPPQARERLHWKRVDALERDLAQALALPLETLCLEPGGERCGDVHRVTLGGIDPVQDGTYQPMGRPAVTSAIALERLALSACHARVERDAQGSPEVFTALDLEATRATAKALDAQSTLLYRRLLARDPSTRELRALRALARGSSNRTWARSACFAIATTTEFTFF